MSKILIQGAMGVEISYLLENIKTEEQIINGYEFYIGKHNDHEIIISRTHQGTINATIATMIGIYEFKPDYIINQGIAGAHDENLHVGDIVVGLEVVNINYLKMPPKKVSEGSNALDWEFNKRAKIIYKADAELVNKLKLANLITGRLGSGDVFSKEIDRINWLREQQGHLCEDMESIGVYMVCNKMNVPVIGLRIISNNDLINEPMDEGVAVKLQEVILDYLI